MIRPFSKRQDAASTVIARWIYLALLPLFVSVGTTARAGDVDFARDVRPILARHCFKCHGPDPAQRKADLRLDERKIAVGPAESGERAIVPGEPDASELVRRISSADADEVMPPPETKNPVTVAERQVLRQWIAEGAEYKAHWAFQPPGQAKLPAVKRADWPRNPIDRFVLARLETAGITPSPAADKHTLVRRVYLDLIGLPPEPAEADAFVNDPAPDAYEKLVDRLLASPHYGERWARRWLDLARYADTNGYEKDRVRSIWAYRDWVIQALNADMPFNQFTVEQLAGDMLPGATLSQQVATGFHRNTMLNEEGGIDPLEFRFYATIDRVNTTATTWLALTLGCAQCHTHKYDPIPHAEYYRMLALLNNADEPELEVPQADLVQRRSELEAQIRALEADLPNRFPVASDIRWQAPRPASVVSAGGATVEQLDDASVRLSGTNPERDTYTVTIDTDLTGITALKIEALTDPALPSTGPGRTPHGNFVLSELTVTAAPRDGSAPAQPLKLVRAAADFAQANYPAAHAIDGDPKTGWAIQGPAPWNLNRSATFDLDKPAAFAGGTRISIRLDQQFGQQHTLGRFRVSLGQPGLPPADGVDRRGELLKSKFNAWLDEQASRVVRWTVLRPVAATANIPFLTVLDDASVLAGGDQSKRDVYQLKFDTPLRPITAIRLEVLPADALPKHGPGRVYYEGPAGDFFLSEITVQADSGPAKLSKASQTFGNASLAIDGDPQSGWSTAGQQGRPHEAVFNLEQPLADASGLTIELLFEKYYAAGLGRFRISATDSVQPAAAQGLPGEIEDLLLKPAAQRTASERQRLLDYYLSVAPELAAERETIQKLREQIPAYPTTLVMAQRPAQHPRPTFRHHRGEFLQPKEPVAADVLSCLPPLPAGAAHDRLSFARWLVDGRNPLVGRVVMNRQWAALFGRGLVRTTEDFGFQGELPTHPELLDWLAVEFVRQGWSLKKMHRLMVTSATYRQSARVSAEMLERDPQNLLLARAPRFRLDAELVRDAALRMSGLLSPKLAGPSVFPLQPANITSEGTYGALAWNVSPGEDRYRRGLYTFTKRTAPYAMFATFDAPSGEACLARREVSNTPLQSLALLNDAVFVEAAQALGRMMAAQSGSDEARAVELFRRVLVRPPSDEERVLVLKFHAAQRERLANGQLVAATIAGPGDGDAATRAAWTLTARTLLNLDETITRE